MVREVKPLKQRGGQIRDVAVLPGDVDMVRRAVCEAIRRNGRDRIRLRRSQRKRQMDAENTQRKFRS